MRRILGTVAALAVIVPAAAAAPSKDDVDRARDARDRAISRAKQLASEAERLTADFQQLRRRAEAAAARLIDAYRAELAVSERLTEAQGLLNRRANAAYRVGPAAFLNALLESRSAADVLASRELIERTIFSDMRTAAAILDEARHARGTRAGVEKDRLQLARRFRELASLRARIESSLAAAQAQARRAGVRLTRIRAARERFLAEQAAQAQAISALGVDQSELLALLGPNRGRGCAIPPRLQPTGRTISGTASWYGQEFAGNPTATGAIFDPALFTAAHKTLPLNSFLRIRWNGRCAVVLVNDRGPFHRDWILDLAQAPAAYLGYERSGTARVEADLLARR